MQEAHSLQSLLRNAALVSAAISFIILGWYLLRRPPLSRFTKVMLLFGLGVMPLGVALSGNIAGFEYTLNRQFCGSCHVMTPYTEDAADPSSGSLAARHSRNAAFGQESCYTCHADYQMFGAVTTKMNGLKHLYMYITEYQDSGKYGEKGPKIHMYKEFQNGMCTRCHSMTGTAWLANEGHADVVEDLRAGTTKCVECHGGAEVHPRAPAHGGTGGPPAPKEG